MKIKSVQGIPRNYKQPCEAIVTNGNFGHGGQLGNLALPNSGGKEQIDAVRYTIRAECGQLGSLQER
jgi:hypothetical protein